MVQQTKVVAVYFDHELLNTEEARFYKRVDELVKTGLFTRSQAILHVERRLGLDLRPSRHPRGKPRHPVNQKSLRLILMRNLKKRGMRASEIAALLVLLRFPRRKRPPYATTRWANPSP